MANESMKTCKENQVPVWP